MGSEVAMGALPLLGDLWGSSRLAGGWWYFQLDLVVMRIVSVLGGVQVRETTGAGQGFHGEPSLLAHFDLGFYSPC